MPIKKIIKFFILLCLFSIPLVSIVAQNTTEEDGWYYGKKIYEIEFKGLKNVTSIELDGITSSFVGKDFSDELYADLLNKIYSLEYFDNIVPRAVIADSDNESIVLEFTVVERPVISFIRYKGNNKIRSNEISDEIAIKAFDIYNESSLLLAKRKIRDLYLSKGYTNASVEYSTEKSDTGIEITFSIIEGKPTIVTVINFQGNKTINSKVLKSDLLLKENSLFNKGVFLESNLNKDKQTIISTYQNRGYINAKITDTIRDVTYNEDENRDELAITFVIDEEDLYTYGGTELIGNTIFSTQELLSLIKLKKGGVFNTALFQQGLSDIANKYYEEGYTSNNFVPQTLQDNDKHIISSILTITESTQSYIGNIIIQGNNKTQDYVITREIPLKEGDIFSKSKLETGLRSLYNLQYFSSIIPDIVPSTDDDSVDLVFNVEEQSTTTLNFGVEFSGVADSDSLPISLFITWEDSNLNGTGKSVSTSLTVSDDTQSIELGYSDSWFLDKTIDFSTSFSFNHGSDTTLQNVYLSEGVNTTDYYMDYEDYSFNTSVGLGKRWVFNPGTVTISGGLSSECIQNFYDSDLYEPVDTTISDDHDEWGLEDTVWSKVSFDARDLSYDPSKGYFVSQKFTWTGLIPEIENEFFLRTDTKGEIYFTLLDKPVSSSWNLKFVLAGYSGLSLLFPSSSSDISTDNQLYIDGMFYGRGWNLTDYYGDALWANYLELRMPLAPGILAADFFFDAIALKDSPSDIFSDLSLSDWRFSFGPSLRFTVAQFPLRLLLANTFKIEDGSVVWDDGDDISDGPQWSFVLSFNISNY